MTTSTFLVGCGAFTGQEAPGPAAGVALAAVVEHAELAEAEGLDSVWLGEHHFAPDGYSAAVFPLLGALAVRTTRLLLGTRVVLGPLHPALLLAEDAAQVAVLAGGRLLLGLGLGYRDEEFRTLRVPKRERVARLLEIVEVCRRAWTGLPFTFAGPTVDAHDVVCRPAPPVPPQIWLGGRAQGALERAARLADGYVAPLGGSEATLALVEQLDALTPTDRPRLPLSTSRLVALRTGGRLDAAVEHGVASVLATYRSWKRSDGGVNAATVSQLDEGVVHGSPEDVVAALAPQVRALAHRHHHLVVRLEYPGMTKDEVAEHLRVFARHVAPALREVAAAATATSATGRGPGGAPR